jgi:hypothetical protein
LAYLEEEQTKEKFSVGLQYRLGYLSLMPNESFQIPSR